MARLLRGRSLIGVSLILIDNSIDEERVNILYNSISGGSIRALTLINMAGNFDY